MSMAKSKNPISMETALTCQTLPLISSQTYKLTMAHTNEPSQEEVKKRRVPLYPGYPELARSDVSIHPSYSKLALAYRVVCRHRYHWAKVAQRKQFMRELHSFEKLQPNALDGVRVHREFSQGILSHVIPPRRYIQKLTPDPLNSKERMRVEEIISGRVNFSQK